MHSASVRQKIAQIFAISVGFGTAVMLHEGLQPKFDWNSLKPKASPVRIAVKAPPAVSAPSAKAQKSMPVRAENVAVTKPKNTKKTLDKPSTESPLPAPPPPVDNELMTLAQPSRVARAQLEAEALPRVLPPVLEEGIPSAPDELSDAWDYPETPGGNVLVLELYVNDQGLVVDAKIAVPSYDGLSDLALHSAALGQRWTDLDPPMRPGELRRLELRIPYTTNDKRFNPLP